MSEPIIIEMPIPSADSGGNNRGHWSKAHRSRKREKKEMYETIIEANLNGEFLSPVHIIIDWYGWNKPDRDNIISRCKGYLDGLVLAALIPDDTPDHVLSLTVRDVEIDRNNPRVLFTIDEVV